MPIGAENIGTAYVRVIADGKDFDLSQLFDDEEGAMGKAGKRASKTYQEAWIEEFSKAPNKRAFDKAISKTLASGDSARAFVNSTNFQQFRRNLEKEFGEIGARAGENLSKEIEGGLDVSQVQGRIENMRRDLLRAERDLNRERRQDALNMAEFGKALNAAIAEDERRKFQYMATLQQAHAENRRWHIEREAAWNAAHAINERMDAEQRLRDMDNLSAKWRRWHGEIRDVADAVGVVFGRGSRNNFLNFSGSVARNVVGLGASLVDLAGHAVNLRNVFRTAGGGVGGFLDVLKEMKGVAIGAVGGLAGLFVVIGPLTSILSGMGGMTLALASTMGGALLGAVSSLASTLAFGLGGSLAIAAASFVPLIAGTGIFALAVANADKETKAAFKSIGREFSDLGEVAAKSTFANIGEQAERFKEVIGDLSPVVSDIGDSLSKVGDSMLDMMEGKGFTLFRKSMEDFLPGAVKDLGVAMVNAFGGFGGLLRSLVPTTEVFLDWLVEITDRFNKFTNSTDGQQTLLTFFARASGAAAELGSFLAAVSTLLAEVFDQANADGRSLFGSMTEGLLDWADALDRNPDIMRGWMDSMESFGEFVGSTRDLLLELLGAGQAVGDSLFGSLSTKIDGFVAKLRSNPDILRDWYDSAGAFARALGDVVVGLGKVFSALDNTFSRALLQGTFEILASLIEGFAATLEGIASIFGGASDAIEGFAGKVAAAALVLPLLSKALGVAALTTFISNLKTAETRMAALGTVARVAAGAGGLAAFASGANQSNDAAGFLMQTLGGAGVGFALGGPWGALIGGTAGAAMSLFSDKTDKAGDSASQARPKFMDLAASLDQVTGAANRATREHILQEAALSGVLSQAKGFGISARDIVSASLGSEEAIKRVNAALEAGGQSTITYNDGMGAIVTMNVGSKKELDRLTASLQAQGKEILSIENAAIDLAASNGIKQFIGESNDAWASSTKKVRENFLATQDLSSLYGKLPKKVVSKIDAEGVAPTIAGVAKVAAKYDLLPREVRSLLRAIGVDLSVKEILKLQAKLDETHKKKTEPRVTLSKQEADQKMSELGRDLDALGRVVKSPKATVDPGNSFDVLSGLRSGLDSLKSKTVYVNTVHTVTGPKGGAIFGQTASGGVFFGSQLREIAEAGPEAVVPLARNLSQVDPSVRWLSAIAQGLIPAPGGGGVTGTASGKTISADGWTIVSNSRDPETVASEVFNRLAGAGY